MTEMADNMKRSLITVITGQFIPFRVITEQEDYLQTRKLLEGSFEND